MLAAVLRTLVLTSLTLSASSFNCQSRIRYPYSALTPDDKALYNGAVAMAMRTGYHALFVEIHSNSASASQTHRCCSFLYWHRIYLLAYENMLRSLDPIYACITVPYWDIITDASRQQNGECSGLTTCSSIIKDTGGLSSNIKHSVIVNAKPILGDYCANESPFNSFCENSTVTGNACVGCLPRSNHAASRFPPSCMLPSIMRQLFLTNDADEFSTRVETNIHNGMHSILASAMIYHEAPAEILFMILHAQVDLLADIWYKCQNGADATVVNFCINSTITPETEAIFNTGLRSGLKLSVYDPRNLLYPFFITLPRVFKDVVNIRRLGANSYDYLRLGALNDLYLNCRQAANRPPQRQLLSLPFGNWPDVTSIVSGSTDFVGKVANLKITSWMDDTFQKIESRFGNNDYEICHVPSVAAIDEVATLSCLQYYRCNGDDQDLNDEFKKNFDITETTNCKKIVDAYNANTLQLLIPEWESYMDEYYPCKGLNRRR